MVLALGCLLTALSSPPPIDPVEVYDDEHVIVETIFVLDDGGGREITPKKPSFRTGSGQRLVGADFYAYVDRPDLAATYRRRTVTNRALIGTGLGMTALGAGLTIGYIAARGRTGTALLASGASLMLGGIIPVAVGGFRSPHPVERETQLALAREKNARIRRRLGLPAQLQFEPVASRFGGGVQITGRF